MKKILITGAGSYVGTCTQQYLNQWPEHYQVDTQDMLGDSWRESSFRGYDVVFHVAAIVHQPGSKDDPAQAELYDRVNHRMAVDVARKAKDEGVNHFIFMSSESVYGVKAAVGKTVTITAQTPLQPKDNYGISKKKAEEGMLLLADERFSLSVLRPPMIYGKGCKGNYQTMAKLARKLPIFPKVENRRSMLYVGNFTRFLKLVIDEKMTGILCPQDAEYVNTSDMVSQIAHANGKGILLIGGFTWALKLLGHITGMVDKAFGSLCYDFALSADPERYCDYTLQEAITATEQK
ncbi:MAG: NAD-dependent epimerase/dehydratase family protein [Oscillospiraceae bacterium]|nr:NAD-dependent epimerase/dehydratase family protein [Oscillospiraceae bacterium]